MAEGGVDLGDFWWKEGAAAQGGKWREGRVFQKKGLQFLPGGLGKDVGEVELGELGTT